MSTPLSTRARAPTRAESRTRHRDRRKTRATRTTPRSIAEPSETGTGGADAASDSRRKRVSMVSLGCPKNTVDGEVMLGDLHGAGFDVTDDHESADAIVINSCGFVEDAKNESVEAILEASQLANGSKKIIVTGCLAQRYANDLANELPEADVIVGFENYANLPKTVGGLLGVETNGLIAPQQARVQVGGASPPFREEIKRLRITPRHTAYLRVAEGCDHKCTFCAIPSFRGRFRSKPWQSIIDEAKALADSGVRELNLIAEDTNQWGIDLRASDGRGLAELLYALAEVEGIEWMRILYAYPSYFSDELIRAIADVPQVCKYIDIPLQHITNLSLLRMNRPPRQHTEDLLYKLRDRIPDLALRTTFISGFPGETEEEHEELMQFCRDFKFERLGAFAYSEEDGTPAMEYPDQVPEEIRAIRRDQLVSQQQEISEDFAMSRVGKDVDVLIDNWDEDMQAFIGRTTLEAPDIDPVVFVTEDKSKGLPPIEPGQMRRCNVIGSSLFDLEAQPIM
jgi:ribosomal protein S12 methylthiotransferase